MPRLDVWRAEAGCLLLIVLNVCLFVRLRVWLIARMIVWLNAGTIVWLIAGTIVWLSAATIVRLIARTIVQMIAGMIVWLFVCLDARFVGLIGRLIARLIARLVARFVWLRVRLWMDKRRKLGELKTHQRDFILKRVQLASERAYK